MFFGSPRYPINQPIHRFVCSQTPSKRRPTCLVFVVQQIWVQESKQIIDIYYELKRWPMILLHYVTVSDHMIRYHLLTGSQIAVQIRVINMVHINDVLSCLMRWGMISHCYWWFVIDLMIDRGGSMIYSHATAREWQSVHAAFDTTSSASWQFIRSNILINSEITSSFTVHCTYKIRSINSYRSSLVHQPTKQSINHACLFDLCVLCNLVCVHQCSQRCDVSMDEASDISWSITMFKQLHKPRSMCFIDSIQDIKLLMWCAIHR